MIWAKIRKNIFVFSNENFRFFTKKKSIYCMGKFLFMKRMPNKTSNYLNYRSRNTEYDCSFFSYASLLEGIHMPNRFSRIVDHHRDQFCICLCMFSLRIATNVPFYVLSFLSIKPSYTISRLRITSRLKCTIFKKKKKNIKKTLKNTNIKVPVFLKA